MPTANGDYNCDYPSSSPKGATLSLQLSDPNGNLGTADVTVADDQGGQFSFDTHGDDGVIVGTGSITINGSDNPVSGPILYTPPASFVGTVSIHLSNDGGPADPPSFAITVTAPAGTRHKAATRRFSQLRALPRQVR